jgi:hypothetical protein
MKDSVYLMFKKSVEHRRFALFLLLKEFSVFAFDHSKHQKSDAFYNRELHTQTEVFSSLMQLRLGQSLPNKIKDFRSCMPLNSQAT